MENFVVAEIEKRRKLGFIKSEQLYYYKSVGGAEIDIIFEAEGAVHAIEIKASKVIDKRDCRNLIDFSANRKNVRAYIFYLGQNYQTIENVSCIPIAALRRGV